MKNKTSKQNKTKTKQILWHVFGVVWSCFVYNKTGSRFMSIITSSWKFNKNIRVMLSRKRRTLHLISFAYIYMLFYCRQNKITQHQKRVTIFVLFSFCFVFHSLHPIRNTKLTLHTLHLIFVTDALFMVSLMAKPVEFSLSYNFESLGSVIFWKLCCLEKGGHST
jgi:hypothetical protein